jgi:two-component system, chemotaxis family, chemotaxis protein CheY
MRDGKHVILCIDDDQDLLDAIGMILEGEGYIMETAGSAEEGLRRYKETTPDFIIVDLMMEEVDAGTNLVKEIKAIGGDLPPIYMLSSVGDSLSQVTNYADLGLSGVLQKPINPDVLVRTVKAKLQ